MEASTAITPLQHWRYRILAPVGSGGMGTVYRAYDRLTGIEVALKQVQDQPNQSGQVSQDARDVRLLLSHEFQMLASLRHPNIISVLDYGFSGEQQPFFTMSLLDNAETVTDGADGLPETEQARLLIQMLMALEYLHTRGIVHRDLKPDNALIADNNVHVLDFGLSVLQSQREEEDFIAGTLAYMAPEVLGQEDATEHSDLYAVGVMMYEMLVGEHPFTLDNSNIGALISQIMFETPDTIDIKNADLADLLEKLLEKDPADRFAGAREVIQELCFALDLPLPEETYAIREGYLQSAPFIGREAEMETLQNALIRTSDAKSEIWLLTGEVGVGKTRLLNELRIRALVNGTLILHGQAVSSGRLPYQIWREPVRRLVLMQAVNDLDASILKDIVPDISQLLERPIPDPVSVDATVHHQRLIETISRLLRSVDGPILLLLEDLQWAGEDLDVLQHLANDINNIESLLIVGSYRSDEAPTLSEKVDAARVQRLERLDYDATATLATSILGDGGKRADLVRFLHEQSEGNVYFLVETIRALANEAGQLRQVANMPLPDQLVAGGINEVMLRRWHTVPPEAQQLLLYAALAGRELDLKVLQNVQDAPDLDTWLTTCSNAYVLERSNEMWQFTHDRLREAIMGTIVERDKPHLYRQLARATEQAYPNMAEQAGTLARFWRLAEDLPKELHYRQIAGDYMLRLSALLKATEQLERALEILPQTNLDASAQKAIRANIRLQLGTVWHHRSQYPDAEAQFKQALALFKELNDEGGIARTEVGLCNSAMLQGHYDEAIRWGEKCVAREEPDTQARALMQLGVARIHKGERAKAVQILEDALQRSRAADDKSLEADVEINLGIAAFHSGELKEAQERFSAALASVREIGEQKRIAVLLNNLGSVMGMQGDLEQSKNYFTEALNIGTETGSRRSVKMSIDNLGVIAMMTEDYSLANRYLEQSLGISLEMGDQPGYTNTLTNIGHVARAEKHHKRALHFYQQAIQSAQKLNAQPLLLEPLAGMASALTDDRKAAVWLAVLREVDAVTGETKGIIEEAWGRVEASLNADALAEAQAEAKAMSLDDLLATVENTVPLSE